MEGKKGKMEKRSNHVIPRNKIILPLQAKFQGFVCILGFAQEVLRLKKNGKHTLLCFFTCSDFLFFLTWCSMAILSKHDDLYFEHMVSVDAGIHICLYLGNQWQTNSHESLPTQHTDRRPSTLNKMWSNLIQKTKCALGEKTLKTTRSFALSEIQLPPA